MQKIQYKQSLKRGNASSETQGEDVDSPKSQNASKEKSEKGGGPQSPVRRQFTVYAN